MTTPASAAHPTRRSSPVPADGRLTALQLAAVMAVLAAYALTALVDLHWLATTAKPWQAFLFEDFGYYVRGLNRAFNNENPYADRSIGTGFLYPPPALLWVALLARLPSHLHVAAQLFSQAACLGLCIAILCRQFGRRALLIAPFWVMGIATITTIYIGQINLLVLLGIVALFVYEDERPRLAGLALATIICAKLSPIIFVVYLVFRRQWSVVVWTMGFCVAWCALTVAVFGIEPFQHYWPMLRYLSKLTGVGWSLSAYAAQIPALLAYPKMVQQVLVLSSGLMVVAASLISIRTRDREPAFMTACVSLVTVPGIVWPHHFVWLLLPMTLFWFRTGCSSAILALTFMVVQVEAFYRGALFTYGIAILIVLVSLQRSLRTARLGELIVAKKTAPSACRQCPHVRRAVRSRDGLP